MTLQGSWWNDRAQMNQINWMNNCFKLKMGTLECIGHFLLLILVLKIPSVSVYIFHFAIYTSICVTICLDFLIKESTYPMQMWHFMVNNLPSELQIIAPCSLKYWMALCSVIGNDFPVQVSWLYFNNRVYLCTVFSYTKDIYVISQKQCPLGCNSRHTYWESKPPLNTVEIQSA